MFNIGSSTAVFHRAKKKQLSEIRLGRLALVMIAAGAGVVSMSLPGGCNIVGPAIMMVHGPEMTQPLYEPEKDKSHVVFVDDRENVLRDRSLRRVIGQSCEGRLLECNAVPKGEILSCAAVEEATAGDKWGKPMGIAQIGASVKADRVIYATIDQFTIAPDGTSLAPTAVARVKVVDTTSKKRLWPKGTEEWHIVRATVKRRDGTMPTSESAIGVEEKLLAERLGREIAHVFVEHQTREPENAIRAPER